MARRETARPRDDEARSELGSHDRSGITLEQARALEALARCKTFAAAAHDLKKGHTAILYAIRTLEEALGFDVLDRSNYRTQLSPAGRSLLPACRELLRADAELAQAVGHLRVGWEPMVRVVFDGIVPIEPLLSAMSRLVREKAPTRIDVRAEFLAGVEEAFETSGADLMIAVLPPAARARDWTVVDLPPLPASLVARADHPLARGRHDVRGLRSHVLLTVRGSDPRLELSTSGVEPRSIVHLNDFASKEAAIRAGLGYGWLPDFRVARELTLGKLCRVRWTRSSTHIFYPRLYHRGNLGPAARRLVNALAAGEKS